ncbi:hypothetical protein HK099_005985 [Clydaea vesicula]|uniref:C2H2-type domain-containing protein n=1 Tax=Clydaea vesicula TaxID=447962 RepID=A0AAD5TYT1_9FUNG|nr:hypothetical protein HK099_005985 [Clydaea vesicula]KAJ3385637.1 hypothetical protein HDU92_002953 [Lobulomyces angularis]
MQYQDKLQYTQPPSFIKNEHTEKLPTYLQILPFNIQSLLIDKPVNPTGQSSIPTSPPPPYEPLNYQNKPNYSNKFSISNLIQAPVKQKEYLNEPKLKKKEGKQEQILRCPDSKCNQFGKERKFTSHYMLKSHLAVHLEKRFSCDDCSKRFGRKHDLQRHCRNIHGKKFIDPTLKRLLVANLDETYKKS